MSNIIRSSDNYAIQKAVDIVGEPTICRLHEFYIKSATLASEYKSDASTFIRAALTVNQSGDTKKSLTALFLELGFKKSYTSKLIEASRFLVQLNKNASQAFDWVDNLPITSAYILSLCSDDAFIKIWTGDSQFGENTLTQHQLEALRNKYDKPKVYSAETNKPQWLPGTPAHEKIVTAHEARQAELIVNGVDWVPEPSDLEKGLKLLKDYPDIVQLIQAKLDEEQTC